MRHPERWSGLLLPVKNRRENEPGVPAMALLGFMFEDPITQQARPTVYVGCMYFAAQAQAMPVRQFADLETLVAAGWEVD